MLAGLIDDVAVLRISDGVATLRADLSIWSIEPGDLARLYFTYSKLNGNYLCVW